MEVPAEAFLVGQPRQAQDHGTPELARAEELERRGLAADLVERVVDVGQVLDLRDRQQADVRGSLRDAQDRGFVEERVEDAPRAEPSLEVVGHVVHAALARDVLAEDDQLRTPGKLVGEGGVHQAGEGASVGVRRLLGRRSFEDRPTSIGLQNRSPGVGGDGIRVVGGKRSDDCIDRGQAGPACGLVGRGRHPLAQVTRDVAQGSRRRRARLDQAASVAQEGIPCLGGGDLVESAVDMLRVAPCVTPQANRLQVQEGRPSRGTDEMDRFGGNLPDLVDLALRVPVAQVRLIDEGLGDPAFRRRHADAGLVVLADEQDRHRQADLHAVPRGVDRRERGRVVHRGVAEGRRDDGVLGKAVRDTQAPRTA